MSSSTSILLLVAVASVSAHAATEVPAAEASTVLIAGSSVVLAGRAETITTNFGAHAAVDAGGQARASVSLGADSASAPFIAYSAPTSGRSFADLTGQVFDSWAVQGAAGDSALYNDADRVRCSLQMSGDIDPIITVRADHADRFSVVQSAIPVVPVPEASTWALPLASLGCLGSVARRRAATA